MHQTTLSQNYHNALRGQLAKVVVGFGGSGGCGFVAADRWIVKFRDRCNVSVISTKS